MSRVAGGMRLGAATGVASAVGAWHSARLPSADASRTGAPASSPVLRLVAFTALAGFSTEHWAGLVQGPPALALAGALLAAGALAAILIALGRLRARRVAVHGAALAATLVFTAVALVAAGLPAGLLQPARWDDLNAEIDRGLAGVQSANWPYAGPDQSVRLVILLGAPLLLSLSAALAFWPLRRRPSIPRGLALLTLLVLYGLAVTERDPGHPLARGAVLLGLVAAWLWLPRLRRREAVPAVVVVLVVGALSLPLAARLDSDVALVDYSSWRWFDAGQGVTFNWNHSYGPLDWPREGTTLLNVRSDRPHYWKAETLDRFDGLRWVRSDSNEGTNALAELPSRADPRWDERIRVTVRSLSTDFVVTAGTTLLVTGAEGSAGTSADGTVRLDEPLRRGDSYTVRSYDPNPSERERRSSPEHYGSRLGQYTALSLPAPGVDALERPPPTDAEAERVAPRGVVEVPRRDALASGAPQARARLATSPYRRTFRLAERLARGAPTTYDVAKRIERHLERNYTYSERPPSRRYPLESFLFRDRIGYCQQFSGAMALMLRMVGVPARVVSGFSPGSLNRDTGEYRVRDLDAHSWVEVYFGGIGWVTFDPTPSAAPADRPGGEPDASPSPEKGAGSISSGTAGSPAGAPSRKPAARTKGGGDDGVPGWAALLGLAALALAGAALARGRRTRQMSPSAAVDASVGELRRALPRLGWELTAAMTLLELERQLGRAAGPRAAGYVSRLRAGRFAGGEADPPGSAERRALRRELTAGGGLRSRLRGFLALPPAGPFTRP